MLHAGATLALHKTLTCCSNSSFSLDKDESITSSRSISSSTPSWHKIRTRSAGGPTLTGNQTCHPGAPFCTPGVTFLCPGVTFSCPGSLSCDQGASFCALGSTFCAPHLLHLSTTGHARILSGSIWPSYRRTHAWSPQSPLSLQSGPSRQLRIRGCVP